jgi:hypothetical protein
MLRALGDPYWILPEIKDHSTFVCTLPAYRSMNSNINTLGDKYTENKMQF